MARYEHLPIYKKAMTLAIYLQDAVRQFSRYDKYTIGSDLRDLSRKIIFLIIRANSVFEKEPDLRELVIHCERRVGINPHAISECPYRTGCGLAFFWG